MNPDTIITVVLLDDHAVVREGYRRLLERAGDVQVVGEAASAAEACKVAAQCRPDVVVMDISLPDMSGIEAMRRLLARDAGIRVLMFSIHNEPIFPRRAFAAGARGYVTKASAPDVLVDAVRTVAVGERFLSPDIAQSLALQGMVGDGSDLELLSSREFADRPLAGARAHLLRDCREALAQCQNGSQPSIAHPTEARRASCAPEAVDAPPRMASLVSGARWRR